MNDLYGSSLGSTVKAIKLIGGLKSVNWTVYMEWRRQGVKEPGAAPRSKSRLKSWLRILLFTPKELVQNVVDFYRELKIVDQHKPDLVIARLDAFRISALWVAAYRKIPLIVEADGANSFEWIHYHGGAHLWKCVLLACEKLMLRRADGAFTQSAIARDYLHQTHRLQKKCRVITNGADLPNPNADKSAELRRKLGIHHEDVVIGFLGTMHHWHGLQAIGTLFTELLRQNHRLKLMFVGAGGAQEQSLINTFEESYRQRVVFTGFIPLEQVGDYISLFTIAIAPYPNMPLFYFSPVKVFDYMAAGKAIVAADIGQIAQILHHGVSALLYQPDDLVDLADCIKRLADDVDLRNKLGKNALADFKKQHTWRHKVLELDRFLHDFI